MSEKPCNCGKCQTLPDRACAICGAKNYHTSYMGSEGKRMEADGICFSCAFWSDRAEKGCPTVIDGWVYTPGTRTTGEFRGMAGRRFDIEYFDGRKVTTFDLWSGGEIPERFRDRIPDTARFVNGAKRSNVGGTRFGRLQAASPPSAWRGGGSPITPSPSNNIAASVASPVSQLIFLFRK
jgi:hypothetical protein